MFQNHSFVCIGCRRCIKEVRKLYCAPAQVKCPECGKAMYDFGPAFQAPRRRDDRQWRKLRMLLLAGYRFYCRRGMGRMRGPGKTLREAKVFVARFRENVERNAIERDRARARGEQAG